MRLNHFSYTWMEELWMSTGKTLTAAHLPILLKGSIIHQLLYVIEFLCGKEKFSASTTNWLTEQSGRE